MLLSTGFSLRTLFTAVFHINFNINLVYIDSINLLTTYIYFCHYNQFSRVCKCVERANALYIKYIQELLRITLVYNWMAFGLWCLKPTWSSEQKEGGLVFQLPIEHIWRDWQLLTELNEENVAEHVESSVMNKSNKLDIVLWLEIMHVTLLPHIINKRVFSASVLRNQM